MEKRLLDEAFIMTLKDTGTENGPDGKRRQFIFAAGVRVRWNPVSKDFEASVISYRRDGKGELQIKFPGGCSEMNETTWSAFQREQLIETGKKFPAGAPMLCHKPFWKDGKLEHIQVFFLNEIQYSENAIPFLKTKTGSEGENSPVRWESLEKISRTIFHAHWNALQKTRDLLLAKYGHDKEKCLALAGIRS